MIGIKRKLLVLLAKEVIFDEKTTINLKFYEINWLCSFSVYVGLKPLLSTFDL